MLLICSKPFTPSGGKGLFGGEGEEDEGGESDLFGSITSRSPKISAKGAKVSADQSYTLLSTSSSQNSCKIVNILI